jgi:hypothetical protein
MINEEYIVQGYCLERVMIAVIITSKQHLYKVYYTLARFCINNNLIYLDYLVSFGILCEYCYMYLLLDINFTFIKTYCKAEFMKHW